MFRRLNEHKLVSLRVLKASILRAAGASPGASRILRVPHSDSGRLEALEGLYEALEMC